MRHATLAIGTLIVAIGISGQAGAARQQRISIQSAVGTCQAPLPNFEGAFRKRPLGIANEGSSPAFISCAHSAQTVNSRGIDTLVVHFINRRAADVGVSCTLINGLASPLGVPSFFPKTAFTTGGNQVISVTWSQDDNGGTPFIAPSISCAIPPGVEINATQIFYDIDVGA